MKKRALQDLSGERFGSWVVIRKAVEPADAPVSHAWWLCHCACGTERFVVGGSLIRGASTQCGCISNQEQSERARTHGMSKSPEYNSWVQMIQRCTNPKSDKYEHYGGRGITIAPQWRESFEAFYEHLGERPSDGHSLDRIDVDGNYEPGNVRWATKLEQLRNQRKTRQFTYNDKTQTLREWCEELDVPFGRVHSRISTFGFSFEDAITMPAFSREPVQMLTHNGTTKRLTAWAREFGLAPRVVRKRLRKGWSVDKALTTPVSKKGS